jgi:hypothetical protein
VTWLTEFGQVISQSAQLNGMAPRGSLGFNAVRWGNTDLPNQAGVAVYARGRTGKIAEARVYDDVEGPR